MYKKFLLTGLVLLAGFSQFPVAVHADEDLPKLRNTFFFVGTESFKFEEFSGSTTIAEESGLRGTIGIGWSNLFVPSGGAVYRASITGYGGIPTYECPAVFPSFCGGVTESESRYAGVRFEGMGGYRFGTKIGVEIFSGIGLDVWNRSIQDSTFTGYDTYNTVASIKLGASLLQRFNVFGYFLRAGVKAPFATWQRINFNGYQPVDLSPGLQMSLFANLDLTFGTLPRDRFVMSFYYDSTNLARSNERDLLDDAGAFVSRISAPASKASTLGVQMIFGW